MTEIDRYRQRTPRSRELRERAARSMPLGVESNFRFFEPYPLFIDRASGARVWDADGNEYIDYALTPEVFPRVHALNARLVEGYNRVIAETRLPAHATGIGANGCIYFTTDPVRNYRDFLKADRDLFWRYYFGMLNRGIIPGGQYYDEQWTVSAVHTEADIEAHLDAFAEVTRELTGSPSS